MNNKNLKIYAFIFILILLSTKFIDIPDLYKSIISLPLYVLIPIFFGNGVVNLIQTIIKFKKEKNLKYNSCIVDWIIGSISMTILALSLNLINIFNLNYLSLFIFLISLYGLTKYQFSLDLVLSDYVLLLLIGLIPAIIISIYAPFPLMHTRMIYVLNDSIFRIIDNYIWEPLSYSSLWFLQHSMISNYYSINPFYYLWNARFLYYPFLALGIYLYSKEISKKRNISLLSSFIGMWILLGFEIAVPLRSVPNYMLLTIFPFILYYFQKNWIPNSIQFKDILLIICIYLLSLGISGFILLIGDVSLRTTFFPVIIIVLFVILYLLGKKLCYDLIIPFTLFLLLLMLHHFEGIFYMTILTVYLLSSYLEIKNKIILQMFMIGTGAFIFVQSIGLLRFEEIFFKPLSYYYFGDIFESYVDFDFSQKLNYLISTNISIPRNSPIIMFLLLVSIIHFGFAKKRFIAITMAVSFVFFVYFFPEPFTYRIDHMSRPFVSILISLLVFDFFNNKPIGRINHKVKSKNAIIRVFGISLFLLLLIPSLTYPLLNFLSTYETNLSEDEYDVAVWIRENLPDNTTIISDFQTMLIMQGISHTIPFEERGMIISEVSKKSQDNYYYIKEKIFLAPDSTTAYNNIRSKSDFISYGGGTDSFLTIRYLRNINKVDYLENPKVVLVISGRTVKWIKNEGIEPVIPPARLDNFELIDKFFDEKYFRILYERNDVYLIEVK